VVEFDYTFIWVIACLIWMVIFIPYLKFGLPDFKSNANRLLSAFYLISILACFLAIPAFLTLQQHSPIYLLSVMSIVWVADIGAYFFGKAFGRHKLAPLISPGKSWEGALGGWLCVVVFGVAITYISIVFYSGMPYNFFLGMQYKWGWFGLCLVLSMLTAASVVGDLVESQLKRRAQIKDSSQLLPGHGGVLDRIDALIFVLPLALVIDLVIHSSGK
jgi:phosphatidate cytidylyltransferase